MSSYDPDARRDTPLASKLTRRIREDGPIGIREYMQSCLYDPEHGYYVHQPAIGKAGDFITAPEISQVFGELIGLWCAVVWQQMGSPARFNLVELGPGRATMLRDALRAAGKVPGFSAAANVQLIEPSRTLREVQSQALRAASVSFSHLDPPAVPSGPSIFLANEVLDCIPVTQLQWCAAAGTQGRWHERVVGLDEHGKLAFGLGREVDWRPQAVSLLPRPRAGDILEDRNARGIVAGIGSTARSGPVAALLVDYGHVATDFGDTLQAVREHRYEHPLTSPGEADLTTQVDFAAFGAHVDEWNADAGNTRLVKDGPITQGEFLAALGAAERASRLMTANPLLAGEIEWGVARLLSPTGMGTRFKVIGLRSAQLPALPGFPPAIQK